MSLTILDPTDERTPVERRITARPEKLKGRLALLDIRKPRGNVLLDRLQELLEEKFPHLDVVRYSKPTFTKPAPDSLRKEVKSRVDLVVEGLAD